jgi:Uma2 family endonuclease
VTFAEFDQIPNPPDAIYELHHGKLVKVVYPEFRHVRTRCQLRRLLEGVSESAANVVVVDKMPFRPLPEYEGWRADLAFLSKARWDSIDEYLFGAPELVIEVLSRSGAGAEVLEKRRLCLENGSREFWVVDPMRGQVEISTPDGHTVAYKSGQEIPLLFGGRLAVDAIFS